MAGIPLHSLQREEEVQIYNEEGTLFFSGSRKGITESVQMINNKLMLTLKRK